MTEDNLRYTSSIFIVLYNNWDFFSFSNVHVCFYRAHIHARTLQQILTKPTPSTYVLKSVPFFQFIYLFFFASPNPYISSYTRSACVHTCTSVGMRILRTREYIMQ